MIGRLVFLLSLIAYLRLSLDMRWNENQAAALITAYNETGIHVGVADEESIVERLVNRNVSEKEDLKIRQSYDHYFEYINCAEEYALLCSSGGTEWLVAAVRVRCNSGIDSFNTTQCIYGRTSGDGLGKEEPMIDQTNLGTIYRRMRLHWVGNLILVVFSVPPSPFHHSRMHAQEPDRRPEFEVASIKPSTPSPLPGTVLPGRRNGRSRLQHDGGDVTGCLWACCPEDYRTRLA